MIAKDKPTSGHVLGAEDFNILIFNILIKEEEHG